MRLPALDRTVFHLALVVLLGALAYSNTLGSPFQWDESFFITDNPIIKDLGYFLDPSKAEGLGQYAALKTRYVGFLTFALNYKMNGLDVTGYHVFNIAVHIVNSLFVYLLIALTFRTPFLEGADIRKHARHAAFFSALLFATHPVQVEAVTYVFQRLASLAACFYLLSLLSYACSRLTGPKAKRYGLYALSLVSAILAMKTKENAFTLPFVIMLYEFFFLSGSVRARALRLIPFLCTLSIVPLALAGADKPVGELMSGLSSVPRGFEGFTRSEYLLTQFRVVVTYMRLLIFPINQNIDYDYPTFTSLSNPQVAMSFLFLSALMGWGIYLAERSRRGEPSYRLIAFGIFWFFITLSVESSVVPIPMVIDEYRVYLPSVGFFAVVSAMAFSLYGKVARGRALTAVMVFLVLSPAILASATYARNSTWKSYISIWEDVVAKSPHKDRGHYNLGRALQFHGEMVEAKKHYKIAIDINPDYARAHNNLGMVYRGMGERDKAIEEYRTAERLEPDYAEVYNNLGNVYDEMGLADRAIEQYREAVRLRPDYAVAHFNLAIVYYNNGLLDDARLELQSALDADPNFQQAREALNSLR